MLCARIHRQRETGVCDRFVDLAPGRVVDLALEFSEDMAASATLLDQEDDMGVGERQEHRFEQGTEK